MPASLGKFIRERRQDLGLTQEELAARIGPTLRQADLSRIEHGHVVLPRRERLEAIATALDLSLGELLVRSGWMTDGDRLAAAVLNVETLSATDVRYPQGITDLADVVADLQAMLAEATQTIEQAVRTLTVAQEALQLTGQAVMGDGTVLSGPERETARTVRLSQVTVVGHERSNGQDPEQSPFSLPDIASGS